MLRLTGCGLVAVPVLLLLATLAVRGDDDGLRVPDIPQLDISVDDDGATTVNRHGETDALDADALRTLLNSHAAFRDEGTWPGRDAATGVSENPVVMHADAMSDAREVGKVYEGMASVKLYRSAIGITEYIDDPLLPPNAPDLDELPDGYLKVELPKDEGLASAPPVPKESITVYPRWSEEDSGGSFVVAIDARGRVPVEKSSITRRELETKDNERRKEVIKRVKKAASDYIAKSGARVEIIEIVFDGGEDANATPWALVDLAYRAALALNEEREKAGREALEFRPPWTSPPVEPPPPEQPPEAEVQYPEDEPEKEDASEDETIVPERDKNGAEADSSHTDRIEGALDWLRDHQHRAGHWSSRTFAEDSVRDEAEITRNLEFVKAGDAAGDKGWATTPDVGLTGLALLAFATYGQDHKQGNYRSTVRAGLLFLRKVQDNDGCFGDTGDDHFVYNHAMATTAAVEMYRLSGDQVLKPICDRAVDFILKAQNPGLGWRYGVQPGINDTSVTGWMVAALTAAKNAGLEFDHDKSFTDASEWFKLVTADVDNRPKCGYDSPGSSNARLRSAMNYDHNPALDAIYIKSMLAMGQADKGDDTVKGLGERCADAAARPKWEHHKIDFYYWYFGSLALHELGGENWTSWNKSMTRVLLDHQRGWHEKDKDAGRTSAAILDEHGSWDPVGAWGTAGGRVYSTAIGALILQTESRGTTPENESD